MNYDAIRVYVAGPYTKPNPNHNTNRAVMIGEEVWRLGYCPYVPHLSHFWDTMAPHPYTDWLDYDMVWLQQCQVVLRFDGESSGADKEVERAKQLGIPVVYSLKELQQAFPVGTSLPANEQAEIIALFSDMLRRVTADGGRKRAAGEKPLWKVDPAHEAAIFSHLNRWKHGERVDADSGAHPLVHLAWRSLAVAWQEMQQ